MTPIIFIMYNSYCSYNTNCNEQQVSKKNIKNKHVQKNCISLNDKKMSQKNNLRN